MQTPYKKDHQSELGLKPLILFFPLYLWSYIFTTKMHLVHAFRCWNPEFDDELLWSQAHVRSHFTACQQDGKMTRTTVTYSSTRWSTGCSKVLFSLKHHDAIWVFSSQILVPLRFICWIGSPLLSSLLLKEEITISWNLNQYCLYGVRVNFLGLKDIIAVVYTEEDIYYIEMHLYNNTGTKQQLEWKIFLTWIFSNSH